MKNEDAIQEKLNEEGEPTGEKLEKKPSDREVQFSKVIDVVSGVQESFLSSEDMTIEDAIGEINTSLSKLLPKPKTVEEPETGDSEMVDKIADTRPPGLHSLGSAIGV